MKYFCQVDILGKQTTWSLRERVQGRAEWQEHQGQSLGQGRVWGFAARLDSLLQYARSERKTSRHEKDKRELYHDWRAKL